MRLRFSYSERPLDASSSTRSSTPASPPTSTSDSSSLSHARRSSRDSLFAALLSISSIFLSWIFAVLQVLFFAVLFLASSWLRQPGSPPPPPLPPPRSPSPPTVTHCDYPEKYWREHLSKPENHRRSRRKRCIMSYQDLQQLRNREFREKIASTRPSPELLMAQTGSVHEAIDNMNIVYQFIIANRFATYRNVRRVFFSRPRWINYGMLAADIDRGQARVVEEEDDAGRDTPIPPGFMEDKTTEALNTEGEDTSPTQGASACDTAEDASMALFVIGEEIQTHADREETDFPASGAANTDGNSHVSSTLPVTAASKLEAHPETNQQTVVSNNLINSHHPLPPIPSTASTDIGLALESAEIERQRQSQTTRPSVLENKELLTGLSDFSEEADIGLTSLPLSPVPSAATLAPTTVDSHAPKSTSLLHEGHSTKATNSDQSAQAQGTDNEDDLQDNRSDPSLKLSSGDGETTDSDSDDDYEPADAAWKVLERQLEFFAARMEVPEQPERTLHRFLEIGRKSWRWAEHITRYVNRLDDFRLEAYDSPSPRVYFSQSFYDSFGGGGRSLEEEGTMTQTGRRQTCDTSCLGASLKKPKGRDTLSNMVERRLLQYFKDDPEGVTISSAHIKRVLAMLVQCLRIRDKHQDKVQGAIDLARKSSRSWSRRPEDDDGTHLLRSKGMNSPLVEVICIDEQWPVGWDTTMTQPERYKIAGKDKSDPMKRLLKSLNKLDEET